MRGARALCVGCKPAGMTGMPGTGVVEADVDSPGVWGPRVPPE